MQDIEHPAFSDSGRPPSARTLTRRERAAVLSRISAIMEYWNITQDDLLADDEIAAPESALPPEPVLTIKYRHPRTGETWNGQGLHPDWLRRALLKEGLRVDELRPTAVDVSPAAH